ncbi:MAG: polyphosphate polymerase domain-containing protein [Clostridia bacterium]|nr:polyphosphate polymerase domain-containing protein [Clostridia bacterium]
MAFGVTFKRYEKKFLLNSEQYEAIKRAVDMHFEPDKYGETKICNLYYDTSDYLTIRRSIEKPIFKEKLRLRTYGLPTDDTVAFCEVKRKFKSVVYKRRIHMPYVKAVDFLDRKYGDYKDTQISLEIKYLLDFYNGMKPQFYISYDRCAFFYKEDSEIRITFDKNITWRNYDLDLRLGSYGKQLLPEGYTLMEIKVPNTVPLWLSQLMSIMGIRSNSFSKVGNAYKCMLNSNYDYRRGHIVRDIEEEIFGDIIEDNEFVSQGVDE